jgi:hypothetical protein
VKKRPKNGGKIRKIRKIKKNQEKSRKKITIKKTIFLKITGKKINLKKITGKKKQFLKKITESCKKNTKNDGKMTGK